MVSSPTYRDGLCGTSSSGDLEMAANAEDRMEKILDFKWAPASTNTGIQGLRHGCGRKPEMVNSSDITIDSICAFLGKSSLRTMRSLYAVHAMVSRHDGRGTTRKRCLSCFEFLFLSLHTAPAAGCTGCLSPILLLPYCQGFYGLYHCFSDLHVNNHNTNVWLTMSNALLISSMDEYWSEI